MKIRQSTLALTVFGLAFSMLMFSERNNFADPTAPAQSFLGRWDLTLKTPVRESPSWLEIIQEGGQLKARLVSRWGHARPPAGGRGLEPPHHLRFSESRRRKKRRHGFRGQVGWEGIGWDNERT